MWGVVRLSGEAGERGQVSGQYSSWDFCLISVFWDESFDRCVLVLYPFKNSDTNIWAQSLIMNSLYRSLREGGSENL